MKKLAIAAMLLLMLCGSTLAQSNVGQLVGAVKGPDGAIAGATVVAKDNQTGAEKTTVTTAEGTYTFPQLDFGTYTVTITASGFKTYTATNLKIDVGQAYSLNTTLEVGDIKETITVTATADVLNAVDGQISNTVTPRQIKELPLNGRDPTSLIQLQAGTSSNGATDTTINGQRSSFTNITQDGINVQDNFIRQNATDFLPIRPTTDNVGEFTVTTQNASADQGNGSSQVQLVTPRGQNSYHGALFEYNRNNRFSANDFFNNADGVPTPKLNRNQYGGAISGPVIKEKLFFFFSYEALRLAQGAQTVRTILTPSARNGIFTFVDTTGKTQAINLLTLPSVKQAGLPSTIDPTVQSRIIANTPTVGNRTDTGDSLNTTGFGFNQSLGSTRDQYASRVDYEINSRNSISGVFNYGKETNERPDADSGGFNFLPVTIQPEHHKLLSLSYRRTGSNFTNELRGGFFKSAPVFTRTVAEPSFFLNIPLIDSPESNFQNQGRNTNTYNIQDNAEYDRGQHSIKFGANINPVRIFAFGAAGVPTVTVGTGLNTINLTPADFGNVITPTDLNTANGLLGLLGGIVSAESQSFSVNSPTSGFVAGAVPGNHLNYTNVGIFAQDQWRVRTSLTINYGLRWEYFSPVTEPDRLALEPVIQSGQTALQAVLNPNGSLDFLGHNAGGDRFTKPYYKDFAPIVSFAYSPHSQNKWLGKLLGDEGRTVIRGGYRMSYVNDELVIAASNALGNNAGLQQTSNVLNPLDGSPSLNARLNALPPIPVPTFQVPISFSDNNNANNSFGTVFGIDPNMHAPRINEVNFGIQREIGANSAIEVRYVGSWSNTLGRTLDFNQIDIRNNGFAADFNRARSNLLLSGGVSGAFNPAIPGSQKLTVFPNLVGGGFLDNGLVISQLTNGTPADLGIIFVENGLTGSVPFLANPNAGVVDLLFNGGKYRYHSMQAEFRRRFSRGLYLQANYTFQKNLTNAQDAQSLVAAALDNSQLNLEYTRALSDQTHVFNLNGIYELPFGAGKRFLNQSGVMDRIVGGWELTSIIRWASGAPITITDPRGTLNRAGRSSAQTPNSTLSPSQIQNLIGVFETPNGVFFFNPASGITNARGRASAGFGTTPFAGQVFTNALPGQTGNLGRALFNGPSFFNWDSSLIKNIKLKESVRLQFRAEAFDTTNNPNFFVSPIGNFNINSANFGKITQDLTSRVLQFALRFEF